MSVVAARGFTAAGLHCGVKTDGVPDLALVKCDVPAAAAAVFTTSSTASPVVEMGRRAVADGTLRAVAAVSGCANAGVGRPGREAAERVAEEAARLLGAGPEDVLLSATGPIGTLLPDDLVRAGLERAVPRLSGDPAGGDAAAAAILTTDARAKQTRRRGGGYQLGGMAKGAGMVRPDMATMLAYLTTDAQVPAGQLREALAEAVEVSFNSLNIDGCQSTNDTVAVLASGLSGVKPRPDEFAALLADACQDLARQMADDAEGATRAVTLKVAGAADDGAARRIGRIVADSALVRTSFYGGDPNWGRLLAAAGVAGCDISPDQVSISYAGVETARNGVAVPYDEEDLFRKLEGDFTVEMTVGDGPGRAVILTNDLTPEYAVFNGERS